MNKKPKVGYGKDGFKPGAKPVILPKKGPKVGYGKDGFKPGMKPVTLPKKTTSRKPSMVKPVKKKPSIKPKKDITKIPGFKFGRGTE